MSLGEHPEGPVVARGRDAVIVDLGGGKLLRQFDGPRDLRFEVAVMRHAASTGFPVPDVFDVRDDAMVLARVEGVNMLDDLGRRPWRAARHAKTLAALHRRLHAIAAPPEWRLTYGVAGHGDVVVHGDLHPGNVMLGPAGPVVIDWTNAGRGVGAEDVADVWLLLAAAQPEGGRVIQALATVLRRRLLAVYLRGVDAESSDAPVRRAAAGLLAGIAARRATDHHMTEVEKQGMAEVVRRHATAEPPNVG